MNSRNCVKSGNKWMTFKREDENKVPLWRRILLAAQLSIMNRNVLVEYTVKLQPAYFHEYKIHSFFYIIDKNWKHFLNGFILWIHWCKIVYIEKMKVILRNIFVEHQYQLNKQTSVVWGLFYFYLNYIENILWTNINGINYNLC